MCNFTLKATVHAHPPLQFFFSQKVEASKYNPLYKTQKFQPFLYISNGSRDMGNYMLEATAHAHSPLQFYPANRKKAQNTISCRNHKNFNSFSISLTVLEIWVIL